MIPTIQICRYPTEEQVLEFAKSALRNAPTGTVTQGLLEALILDMKDGLHALQEKPINWRDDPTAIVEDDEPMIGRDYA